MFHLSSKHHFDTMFVILCVIAGASSHTISNTSKTSINQLTNHHRASFIDFILDASLIELLQTSNTIAKNLATPFSSDYKSNTTIIHQQSQTVCTLMSNILNGNQMKYCHKHQDVLETILPQIAQLTKKECTRVTSDLKWNCSAIDTLLDRTSPLSFTREAAFVKSILNASMMYLVVKTCSEDNHRSCGCQNNQRYSISTNTASRLERHARESSLPEEENIEMPDAHGIPTLAIDQQDFSPSDISKLRSGSPLRLTKSIVRRQGCLANTAFASAFTRIFIDSDDTRALNKAYRILNEEQSHIRGSNVKRIVDSDYKDLAFIKWTKAAINLHNNNVGRQMVREATRKRCRCHGLSGVCQFQTCWEQLLDFDTITSRLRSLYLNNNSKVEVKNLGTFERPDLYLTRSRPMSVPSTRAGSFKSLASEDLVTLLADSTFNVNSHSSIDRVKPGELIYLYNSPDYCNPQPRLRHFGTKGRTCALVNNITKTTLASKKSNSNVDTVGLVNTSEQESLGGAPGSCEELCCNRGYYSELILDMVNCNCSFKFCCKVECDHCLRQRVQHYCL